MELQSSFIWTMDGGNEVHMISSTQAPQGHQKYVSSVLGLPMSKVVCKVKRVGGGFGGKETRSAFFAAVAAVPAYIMNRQVKLWLDRDIDIMTSGQRHSFLGKYKVGFTNEGKILALDLETYNNEGNSLDHLVVPPPPKISTLFTAVVALFLPTDSSSSIAALISETITTTVADSLCSETYAWTAIEGIISKR